MLPSEHSPRHKDLNTPQYYVILTTKLFEESVAYDGMLIYNSLSSIIKSMKSVIEFKKIFINLYLKRDFIKH